MKSLKFILSVFFLLIGYIAQATSVSTTTVSGNWNLSGSPYIVMNNITIPSSSSLTIDPGVEVIFQGCFSIEVYGMLIANGNSSNHIRFHAADTTDWWNDAIPNGGWRGIHYYSYSGTNPDASVFSYCDVSDVKGGTSITSVFESAALICTRSLHISYSTFSHCQSLYSASNGNVIQFYSTGSPYTIEFDHNTISNTTTWSSNINNQNQEPGSYTWIHDNTIFNNKSRATINSLLNNCLIEKNELYSNESTNDDGIITLSEGIATIRNNKIHHNKSEKGGAIVCNSGKIKIENNLICNNYQTTYVCGGSIGGAGLQLKNIASSSDFESTFYTVRNNIISNNSSENIGGAIFLDNTSCIISNNHILNNRTTAISAAIYMSEVYSVANQYLSKVVIKNNIILGNQSFPAPGLLGLGQVLDDIQIQYANTVEINNNYMDGLFSDKVEFILNNLVILAGDTLQNVIGTNPMMINPTTTSALSDDATLANFNIQISSLCINAGDTLNSSCSLSDYLGNQRFVGNKIDIGAFEYRHNPLGIETGISKNDIVIFPNPCNELLNIISTYSNGKIEVYNSLGLKVYEQANNAVRHILNVQSWSNGFYLIKLFDSKESKSATSRFIKY